MRSGRSGHGVAVGVFVRCCCDWWWWWRSELDVSNRNGEAVQREWGMQAKRRGRRRFIFWRAEGVEVREDVFYFILLFS